MNPSPQGDPSLVLPAPPCSGPGLSDDERWFKEEVQPHERAFRSFLQRQVPAPADVDDVVQESYLKLLKAKAAGPIAFVKSYLFTTGRNTAWKLRRKQQKVCPVPVSELPEWRVLDGEQDVVRAANLSSQRALIAEAVAQLPDRCREIFVLRTIDGLSFAEIAAKLGLAEGTVRVQVSKALDRCATYLEERQVKEK